MNLPAQTNLWLRFLALLLDFKNLFLTAVIKKIAPVVPYVYHRGPIVNHSGGNKLSVTMIMRYYWGF